MTSSGTIILTHPEDWETWLAQLRAVADIGIWRHIDPDNPAPQQGLLEEPVRPEIRDFNINANTYAQLSAVLQKAYENSRRYYDQDMKYYFRQEDLLRAVRTHITTYVSKPKQLLLDPTLSVRDWLVRLKEDTQPTDNYMQRKALQQYTESLKGLKATKINQWLDSWEHAMKMAIKYKIPQMSLGLWLTDLAQAVRPLSETYFVLYNKQAKDSEKAEPSEYRKMAMELREALANLPKKGPSTVRGSTFNTEFGEEDPASGTEDSKGRGRSRSRKRAGTTSIEGESSPSKKSKDQCPACDFKGHALQDCWILFEDKRPEGFKITRAMEARAKKVKERIAKDKELATQVENLRLQGGTADEA